MPFPMRHDPPPPWVIVALLAGIAALVVFVGTPHVGWDYICNHRRYGNEPCRSVEYCAYYGIQGRRLDYPPSGEQCQIVKFLPVNWGKVFEGL